LGRKRTVHFDLPPRLQRKGESYYYVCNAPRRWIPLGTNLERAKRKWAELECAVAPLSVSELLDRYIEGQTLAYSTRKQYRSFAKAISKDLTVPAMDLRAVHVALWRDAHRKHPGFTNGCLRLLGAAWNKGREWGVAEAVVSVALLKEKPRDRYLTDDEFRAIREKAPVWLQIAMDLAYLTAARPVDVRSLKWDKVGERLGVRQIKTGTRQEFVLSPELQEVLARAKARPILGLYVIALDNGRPVGRDRMGDAWIAAREAAGVDAQFRDIRAKAATDAESGGQDFQALLGHSTRKMSERYLKGRRTVVADPVKRRL
jgi:integrase